MIGPALSHLAMIWSPERGLARDIPRVDLIVMTLAGAGGLLLVLGDVVQRWVTPSRHRILNIDGHANIETWFHAMILGLAGAFAIATAATYFDNRHRRAWLIAGAGVTFFSMDKSLFLHEIVGRHLVWRLSLPEDAGSVAWEVAWAPLILVTGLALVYCVREANGTARFWAAVAILGGAGKIGLEALTFPLFHFDLMSEAGWLYGVEANVEESVQLVCFAGLLAAFSQYFVDRLVALAAGEPVPERELTFAPALAVRNWGPVRAAERRVFAADAERA